MKSIYHMMGRHTYPLLREEAPLEHVERFFQVSAPPGRLEDEGLLLGEPLGESLPSLARPLPPGSYIGNSHPAVVRIKQ